MQYSKKAILLFAASAFKSSSAFAPGVLQATPPAFSTLSVGGSRNEDLGKGIVHHSTPFTRRCRRFSTATSLASTLTFAPSAAPSTDIPASSMIESVIIGRKASLTNASTIASMLWLDSSPDSSSLMSIKAMLSSLKDSGKASTFLYVPNDATGRVKGGTNMKLTVIVLPSSEKLSRNNHPFSVHTITDQLSGVGSGDISNVQIHVMDSDVAQFMCPAAAAIARAFPLYNAKSGASASANITVSFANEKGETIQTSSLWSTSSAVSSGIRLAARLGDMPPAELNPDSYSQICHEMVNKLVQDGHDVNIEEIKGKDLQEGGFGGIYGVGMCARDEPRMVVMTYTPKIEAAEVKGEDEDGNEHEEPKREHIALCGKGVIYDTGGLSLKPKTGMCGMKHDMGGSAGVLGGFQAAVQLELPTKISLVLAIVENAIGPEAVRNDDILTMKSGKTVEINNTDAEGRLILADCVSYASNSIPDVDVILDMATLTGAQLITTGKKHAGILAKTEAIEERIVKAGKQTGDLVYPMLYAPELLKGEFASKVADMKNSVKDRSNAQASCAGHFIESHIDSNYQGDWVHVDMAGPDSKNERATGYGVALVLGLLNAPGFH